MIQTFNNVTWYYPSKNSFKIFICRSKKTKTSEKDLRRTKNNLENMKKQQQQQQQQQPCRKPKLSRHDKLNPANIALSQEETQKQRKLSLMIKMLLPLSAVFSVYCYLCSFRLSQWQSFFSAWTQYCMELLKILNVTSDHLCHKYFRFLVWKCFSQS